MAIYSRSSLQNTYYRWFWLWKNKCSFKPNNQSARYCKIYQCPKYPYEAKYQYLIKKRAKVGLVHFKVPRAFMEYSNDMEDVYKNIEDYNPGKKRKI